METKTKRRKDFIKMLRGKTSISSSSTKLWFKGFDENNPKQWFNTISIFLHDATYCEKAWKINLGYPRLS